MAQLLSLVPLIYVLVLPIGVAGQNIGLAIALLILILFSLKDRGEAIGCALKNPLIRQFLVLWSMIVIPIVVATYLSGKMHFVQKVFGGYLFGAMIPIGAVAITYARVSFDKVDRALTGVLIFAGIIAASQMALGWKFEDGAIATTIHRARGLYSHPLTLAYAFLLYVPYVTGRLMNDIKSKYAWVAAMALTLVIVCSESVTVIVVTLLIVFVQAILILTPRARIILLGMGLLVGLLVVCTPNRISEKFHDVLSGQRGDHETPYSDDRIAFWHAHIEMFRDAPLIGHGSGLEAEDRAPYYDRIGLGSIKRMYEAHNMYLEAAVEGGVVAFLGLIAFFIWLVRVAKSIPHLPSWQKSYLVLTPVAFCLGGLTQNAIQDAEVRFTLLGFVGVLLATATRQASKSP